MSSLDAKMKECMKPHSLMHSLSGIGLGVVVATVFSGAIGANGIMFGILLIAAGIVGDMMVNKG